MVLHECHCWGSPWELSSATAHLESQSFSCCKQIVYSQTYLQTLSAAAINLFPLGMVFCSPYAFLRCAEGGSILCYLYHQYGLKSLPFFFMKYFQRVIQSFLVTEVPGFECCDFKMYLFILNVVFSGLRSASQTFRGYRVSNNAVSFINDAVGSFIGEMGTVPQRVTENDSGDERV